MAITNQERVGKGMELLRAGVGPYVEREVQAAIKTGSVRLETIRGFAEDPKLAKRPISEWDVAGLLKLMWETWNDVFRRTLGYAERTLVSELRDVRNRWAHQEPFSGDDTDRALDSMARLLTALSASQADEVNKMKLDLRRLQFDEQVRSEKKKSGGSLIEPAAASGLKPWREVVTPHADVANGRYQQAEFAADLWQVHLGEGSEEYRNPREFFRRTYLTSSLRQLLVGSAQRLAGTGGDPVVQLQTNFGGGKTHSMLALYHMFSGVAPGDLPGLDDLFAEAGVKTVPKAKRVVLVGNKISPGNPVKKPDGTLVCTLWGELAWQIGGKKAFARVAADDERATNPGHVLHELFKEYGPCLVLIDEWVAYARQLHDQSDLPAGGFETQFTFAQALTESARTAGNCLLVISLPASDTQGSPHTQADDVEVGGVRGREALDRLRNVVGRVESSWRPATAEEGFEIVRRRLFEPLSATESFKQRDVTARAFGDLYRSQKAEFPQDCGTPGYERRIQAAYPIHPEIFDQLYGSWSSLIKFQRTRGVLRLMAAVIHSLWDRGDRNPMILPSMIPIDDPRVQSELTRYLSDNWAPIIEKDVDGPGSLPQQIDSNVPNLGKLHATRRVARTIYMGSAPTTAAAHRGIEDRQVKLGCVMPGESPAIFGDALRRLAAAATYLYQDGTKVWYSTQPTVTKLAEEKAEQYKREPDRVIHELERRLREDLRRTGDFSRIHPLPQSGQDVPDDLDARLVVLSVDHAYTKEAGSAAETAAQAILETRGTTPRLFRNTLVFLAADKTRLQDLDEAVRRFLAWEAILADRLALNLDPLQVKQAEAQLRATDGTVTSRIPETYQWLLVPVQANKDASAAVTFQSVRVSGQEPLAVRASKKLRNDESLIMNFAPSRLRMELDRVPLWRGDHVAIKQLVEDFARYPYLPRLGDPAVLLGAVRDGIALLTWEQDAFAFAESFDELAGRYRGLRAGQQMPLMDPHSPGLLVRPEVGRRQLDAEAVRGTPGTTAGETTGSGTATVTPTAGAGPTGGPAMPAALARPKRYHGTVSLDPTRVGRDASRVADEVLAHLVGLVGSKVRVTLEIEADIEAGVPENVVRIVTENGRELKFSSHGFEKD